MFTIQYFVLIPIVNSLKIETALWTLCIASSQKLSMSLHLQEGALLDHEPISVQVRFCCPSSLCPSGHWYPIVAPTLKFEPEMVVLTSLSGLPHEEGAANRHKLHNPLSPHTSMASYCFMLSHRQTAVDSPTRKSVSLKIGASGLRYCC
jgi:hypothetical protein